jgi:peptide/nickel transport system permease protein
LKNAASGDLGESYLTREPVLGTIIVRLPVTLELLIISQCMALMLALPLGIVGAYRSDSMVDRFVNGIGFATLSIPSFVMALLTIYLFSIKLRWLPATGYVPLSVNIGANLKSFILPGLSIAMIEWVVLMRVLRSDMITTLGQNYILMAKAKGLPPWRVLLQHALRPSSFTLITVLGMQIGRHLGEAVIVETIFALPGIGRLLIDSIYARDYQMVQGCVLLITIGYVIINSVVDLLYTVLDPRIRTEGGHAG